MKTVYSDIRGSFLFKSGPKNVDFSIKKSLKILIFTEIIFYSKADVNFGSNLNRLIGTRGTKKTPPLSWSTRVNQEGGGAQNFIMTKNG